MYTVPISPGGSVVAVVVEDADLVGVDRLADGARLRQPLVGVDERAAALGRGVVLADDRAEPLDHPRFTATGHGAAPCSTKRSDDRS